MPTWMRRPISPAGHAPGSRPTGPPRKVVAFRGGTALFRPGRAPPQVVHQSPRRRTRGCMAANHYRPVHVSQPSCPDRQRHRNRVAPVHGLPQPIPPVTPIAVRCCAVECSPHSLTQGPPPWPPGRSVLRALSRLATGTAAVLLGDEVDPAPYVWPARYIGTAAPRRRTEPPALGV